MEGTATTASPTCDGYVPKRVMAGEGWDSIYARTHVQVVIGMLFGSVGGWPVTTCDVGLVVLFTRRNERRIRVSYRGTCPISFTRLVSNGEGRMRVRRAIRVEVAANGMGHPTIAQPYGLLFLVVALWPCGSPSLRVGTGVSSGVLLLGLCRFNRFVTFYRYFFFNVSVKASDGSASTTNCCLSIF